MENRTINIAVVAEVASALKELKQKMDKHELETESARLIKQFNDEVQKTKELFNENDNPLEFKQFISLKND
ncbi:MAG: hypothetical protein EOM23_11310 [Candidatus Moranbacteria bacterium]|nr:hypothetical protein [Candidatus Moranbacteria bacterium]